MALAVWRARAAAGAGVLGVLALLGIAHALLDIGLPSIELAVVVGVGLVATAIGSLCASANARAARAIPPDEALTAIDSEAIGRAKVIDLGVGASVHAWAEPASASGPRSLYRSPAGVTRVVRGDLFLARTRVARACASSRTAAWLSLAATCVGLLASLPVASQALDVARCDRGHDRACTAAGRIRERWYRAAPADVLPLYRRACSAGDADGCALAEHASRVLAAIPGKPERAYESACRAGDGAACFAVAHAHQRQSSQLDLLEIGCKAGNRRCCSELDSMR